MKKLKTGDEFNNFANLALEDHNSLKAQKKSRLTNGGRNLMLLGLVSILITVVLTSISLAIYHNSGDIYLDRSRPGFLPDNAEIEQNIADDSSYDFEKSGRITAGVLEEYIVNLKKEAEKIDALEKPFGAEELSDEKLGITED